MLRFLFTVPFSNNISEQKHAWSSPEVMQFYIKLVYQLSEQNSKKWRKT